eukprot:5148569-Alexandrium_andersonii.AAC.1
MSPSALPASGLARELRPPLPNSSRLRGRDSLRGSRVARAAEGLHSGPSGLRGLTQLPSLPTSRARSIRNPGKWMRLRAVRGARS